MPPNDVPTAARMDKALGQASKRVEVILLGDLNVRLQEPRDVQEEELAKVAADCVLEDMTDNFTTRMRYRGDGC